MARRVPTRSSLRGEGWLHKNAASVPERAHTDTVQLYAELQDRHRRSPFAAPGAAERLAAGLLAGAVRDRKLPKTLHEVLALCVRQLIAAETHLFEMPALPAAHSVIDGVAARELIRDRLVLFDNVEQYVNQWITTLASCLASIVDAFSNVDPTPTALVVTMPVVHLVDNVPQIVGQIVKQLIPFTPDPRATCTLPGATLAASITANLLAASRMTFEAAQKHPERLRWPDNDRMLAPHELVTSYLGDTPLASLFAASIPVPVPDRIRFEASHLLAKHGHGKSQALQHQITNDIDDPRRPALFVMDSSNDLLGTMTRLARFDPAHDQRAVIIDAGDTYFPLQFNPFDINRDRLNGLDLGQREEILAGVVELLAFAFETLSSDLTGRQTLVLRMLCQWMLEIPNATIHTMADLLTAPDPFFQYTAGLTPTAQRFINEHLYSRTDKQYADVCRQLHRRLFELLSIPAFERCLSSAKNAIDFKQMFAEGRIVFINTARARLKDASATFGKIMLAKILQAILERAADPEHTRRPVFGYIDEVSEYMDGASAPIDKFILQCRKFKCGLTLCHQNMEGQTKRGTPLRAALMTTAIRFVGEVSAADAATLAPEMKTSAEFLLGVRRREASAEFAVHVRNVTPTATKVVVPFFVAENAPKMSDAAYQKLLARSRAQVATPLTTGPPKQGTVIMEPRPSTDDDFGERY